MLLLIDYNGNATSKADISGHRGEACGHHQIRKLDQGATRHVHGHGDAGREPGKVSLSISPIK